MLIYGLTRQLALRIRLIPRRDQIFVKKSTFATDSTPTSVLNASHKPPLAVRVGIVGTSVGLATPLFATVGVARMWYAYLPRTPIGAAVKYAVGVLVGGGCINLVYNYVGPFLRDHSDFILPFALANGVASSFWYLVGEAAFGLEAMTGTFQLKSLVELIPSLSRARVITHFPIGGVVIGALTAVTAPFLWPLAFNLCWDENTRLLLLDNDTLWLSDLYQYIVVPVGIPTGISAGISIHLALKSAMLGIPGTPWQRLSLPVFGGLIGAASVYFTWFRSPSHDFMWEQRIDVKSGNFISYNVVSGESFKDDSRALNANLQRAFSKVVHTIRRPLHGWFAKGDISVKKKVARSIRGLPITVEVIDERTSLFHIVDMLVRWRYLQQQLQSSSSSSVEDEIKKLGGRARDELGITDLSRLTKDVEVALVALRHIQQDANQSEAERRAAVGMFRDSKSRIINAAAQSFGSMEDRSHSVYVLEMLTENLPILEDELKTKLGYSVASDDAQTKEIISDYHIRRRYETVIAFVQRAVFVSSMGAFATCAYYYLKRN